MRELISADTIARRVRELGTEISRDYANSPDLELVGLLRGSICFLADLMRAIDCSMRVDFLTLRSYTADQGGNVQALASISDAVRGADVLVVEDIVERGATLAAALEHLRADGPRSVEVCTLLRKDGHVGPRPRYVGFEVGPEFIVGYGLDYDQRFRNLPFIGLPDEADLQGRARHTGHNA